MKKNVLKICFIVLIALIIVCYTNISFADQRLSDLKEDGQVTVLDPGESVNQTRNQVVGFVQAIAIVVSIATLMYIGIRYMISSVEERANMKKTIPYYLIGAFLAFGIVAVLHFLADFAEIF